VKAIDVVGVGEEISVIPLQYADVSDLAQSLNTVFTPSRVRGRKASAEAPVKIVPDERTNVLILLATEEDTLKIKKLIELLDKETPPGEKDIHVYYLQNANAEDLTTVLTNLPAKQAAASAKGKAPVISKEVQIVADKATNTLVITADKDDFRVLGDVIAKLDIPRPMVYIEALIMEVKVDKDFKLGVQWHAADDVGSYDGRKIGAFGGSTVGESILPVDPTTGTPSFPSGLSLGVLGETISIGGIDFFSIDAVLRAYETDSDVRILSRPQILTLDNEEAEIKVGENVPYLTTTGTTTAGRDYESYEYKDVGITLKITPQINRERLVRLAIFQEVTKVTAGGDTGRPTTLKRSAQTTVTVKDKNTVVIGGLIGEDITKVNSKVPCLGDIPGLGWLFKSILNSSVKTNLFVFLTPRILESPREATAVYEQKQEEIDKIIDGGSIKLYEKREKE
jgi:general secretion pathway protein D